MFVMSFLNSYLCHSQQTCSLTLPSPISLRQLPKSAKSSRLKPENTQVVCCELPNNGVSASVNSQTLVNGEENNYRVVCEVEDASLVLTEFVAETQLPTIHGRFRLRGYRHSIDGGQTGTEPVAVIMGKVEEGVDVKVRVHDACFTSEVLGSMKCDCAQQLELALNMIQDDPPGMLIYLQQEGRGIGLANKIAAYKLQEEGLDTVDANRALGLPDDCREYTSVVNILKDLNIQSIKLMTNNPRKIDQLKSMGINVVDRIPVIVEPGKYNQVNNTKLQQPCLYICQRFQLCQNFLNL
eukprot:TRINITY_DN5038_c0_g2_i2.p1 TRINITY_DN5038_c0_g2~~TRINITY_DN5038_c0_g2_i2.p1  ORF type:complete len:296 (+),score=21.52 TRINITY_DN5038_c0_g2_i2:118-1005(+)